MKHLFVLLALCVATLITITVAVFLRIRKHRREFAGIDPTETSSGLPVSPEREHKA
jgi:hypothetical protein